MQELIKKTTLYGAIYLAVAMCAIVYFGVTGKAQDIDEKTEVIAEIDEETDKVNEAYEVVETDTSDILVEKKDNSSEYIMIPLPDGVVSSDILIENHYMDYQLKVLIKNVEADFFAQNKIVCKKDNIKEGHCEKTDEGVRLCFATDDVYEYRTVLENNSLYVTFYSPKEIYDKIIVIDAACGGDDAGCENENSASSSSANASVSYLCEKDIVLEITKKIKSIMDEDETIKVYYTRLDDVNPKDDVRINLANSIKADAYIRIEVDYSEDASIYGITCKYNDSYFIPGFGNVELSDLIEKSVTTSVKGRALGLFRADISDTTLIKASVPATTVLVGYLSNKQEAILLGREDYLEKIARGIVDGIYQIYE